MNKPQSGFTLIEIAIVLVIIGLLLGGIRKGEEMITNAKVRNLADRGNAVKPPSLLSRIATAPCRVNMQPQTSI
jgi:prepilin-type N-terminal cleavage/methylation domain-containing protein